MSVWISEASRHYNPFICSENIPTPWKHHFHLREDAYELIMGFHTANMYFISFSAGLQQYRRTWEHSLFQCPACLRLRSLLIIRVKRVLYFNYPSHLLSHRDVNSRTLCISLRSVQMNNREPRAVFSESRWINQSLLMWQLSIFHSLKCVRLPSICPWFTFSFLFWIYHHSSLFGHIFSLVHLVSLDASAV